MHLFSQILLVAARMRILSSKYLHSSTRSKISCGPNLYGVSDNDSASAECDPNRQSPAEIWYKIRGDLMLPPM